MAVRVGTNYLQTAFTDTDQLIATAQLHLRDVEFDTLVGTGLSGAMVVPVLARALGVNFLIVRKQNDGSHSKYKAEGYIGDRWLFVDDLIASGATRRRVFDVIDSLSASHSVVTEYAGTYLYYDYGHPSFDAWPVLVR